MYVLMEAHNSVWMIERMYLVDSYNDTPYSITKLLITYSSHYNKEYDMRYKFLTSTHVYEEVNMHQTNGYETVSSLK
jgi:hypothetical protein